MLNNPVTKIAAVVAGIAAIAFVLLGNSSPYVSVAQAKTMKANNLHLQGDLVKDSIRTDAANATVSFTLIDKAGDKMNVIHQGMPPANMGEATMVVAVGGMKGDHFESTKLLTKCPSKYEADKKSAADAGN
jgi:cytochrome c-type biogenesis protein CcmE